MRRSILMLALTLAGCATTDSGGGITIETTTKGQPLPGANCVVRTFSGTWNIIAPATVAIGGPNGDLRVLCDKPGYRTSEVIYRPSSGYSGSGLGIGVGGGSGGGIGVGVGLSVPIISGRSGYPPRITVDMNLQ
jgi:hypothetical protein